MDNRDKETTDLYGYEEVEYKERPSGIKQHIG